MAEGSGPVNIPTVNVGTANIQRAQMSRQDMNTGDAKTGEGLLLKDIHEALGKVTETFKNRLDDLGDKIVKALKDMQDLKGGRGNESPHPLDHKPNLTERKTKEGVESVESLMKQLNDNMETLVELTVQNNHHAHANHNAGRGGNLGNTGGGGHAGGGGGHGRVPGGANVLKDRLSLLRAHTSRHREAMEAITHAHRSKVGLSASDHQARMAALAQNHANGNINSRQYFGKAAKHSAAHAGTAIKHTAIYAAKRHHLNSLNRTTLGLVGSFLRLTEGVDGVSMMMKYVKTRYSEDGGYKTMVQSGYGGASEAFFKDLLPHFGDSEERTGIAARRAMKDDSANEMLNYKTLGQASSAMTGAREGVTKRGYSLLDRMDVDESKDTLLDLSNQLKRSGMIQKIDDDKSLNLMTEQLKFIQQVGANTYSTVQAVRENTKEFRKKTSDLSASGRLTENQAQEFDKLGELVHNNATLKDLIGEMRDSGGNVAAFATNHKDTYDEIAQMGDIGKFSELLQSTQDRNFKATPDFIKQLGEAYGAKNQGSTFMNVLDLDKRGRMAAFNQFGDRSKTVDTTETTGLGILNRLDSFFKENWGGAKAIGGAVLTGASVIGLTFSNFRLISALNSLRKALPGGGGLAGAAVGALGGGILGKVKGWFGKGAGAAAGATGAAGGGIMSLLTGAGGAGGIIDSLIGDSLGDLLGGGLLGAGGLLKAGAGKAVGGVKSLAGGGISMLKGLFGGAKTPGAPSPITAPSGAPDLAAGIANGAEKGAVGPLASTMGKMKGLTGAAGLAMAVMPHMFKGQQTIGSMLSMGTLGMEIGTMIAPGLGTAIGGVLGAGAGALMANIGGDDSSVGAAMTAPVSNPMAGGGDWTALATSIAAGFQSNLLVLQDIADGIRTSNTNLARLADTNGNPIVRNTVAQARRGVLQPGVQMV